jgi:transposase
MVVTSGKMSQKSEAEWYVRKRKAIQIVASGKGYREIGEAWGVSNVAAYKAVTKRWPNLAEEIAYNNKRNSLPPDKIRERLKKIKNGMSVTDLARIEGVTSSAISTWIKRMTPFGIDEALDLYSED